MDLIPIRRFVNADNSCLFSSIAYLTNKDNFNDNSAFIYRLMVADYINTDDFDENILTVPKNVYINKITDIDEWGGGIELSIFSKIFQIQIAVMNLESGRVDCFGEVEDYENVIYIIYDGKHYDPLVMNVDKNAETNLDITIFKKNDYNKLIKFKEFVETI
uniref:ubiquitinyl hydrolase 1 n=1 Tax=Megaviridae environmental sample TaxID=1737588 RepID=A0A5J6VKG1_9VIRU|nr:MAG: hypothetical protein [Megaviridae environmental sample]